MTDKEQIAMLRERVEWLAHHLLKHHQCLHMENNGRGIARWVNRALAATAPSAQGQEKVEELPSSEFEEFQAWHVRYGPGFRKYSRLNEHEQRIAWQAWQARAALRSE